MSDFTARGLRIRGTLGERLQKVRIERGVELETVADSIHVQLKHLKAIEESRYLDLPSDVYVRNFLRQLAVYLDVNAETVIYAYDQERKVFQSQHDKRARASLENEKRIPRAIITPQTIKRTGIILVVLAIVVYLGVEARRITAPPELILRSPAENIRITEPSILVEGTTEPEATIFINDEEVVPDSSGNFSETLELTEGLNTIVIISRKPRGAEQKITRSILVEPRPS
ncbi:MAG: helix-turn-helix domain-containing protein [Patescibacteria group bacterium]|jgi:cytoskeletal protein RodZ